jgi:hypothetical protein
MRVFVTTYNTSGMFYEQAFMFCVQQTQTSTFGIRLVSVLMKHSVLETLLYVIVISPLYIHHGYHHRHKSTVQPARLSSPS